VDNASIVRRLQRLGQLFCNLQRLVQRYRSPGDSPDQVFALDEFHYEGLNAICRLEAVNGRDVWVIQGCENLSFALKPGQPVCVRR
jgi:hypothetical protein